MPDKRQILLVDDSSLARMLVRNLGKNHFPHWQLLEAADPEQARELLQKETPLVALVDYNMPQINGLDLALQLLEQAPQLDIHLVTANIQDRIRQRAEAAGIGFMCKPLQAAELEPILQKLST